MVGQTFLLLARRVRRGRSSRNQRRARGKRDNNKKKNNGRRPVVFCFARAPLRRSLSLRAWAATLPGPGGFFVAPSPPWTLTHCLTVDQGDPSSPWPGGFFLFAPRLERKETTKAKKHTGRGQGGVFFCSPPTPTLTHLLRAWATTLPGRVVVLFLAPAPPNPASQQQRKSGLLHRV